jgi:hypothetical protein
VARRGGIQRRRDTRWLRGLWSSRGYVSVVGILDSCFADSKNWKIQGVYTNAAVQLGKLLDSAAFKVWSTVLAVLLVVVWLWNVFQTIWGLYDGSLIGKDRQEESSRSSEGE